MGILRTYECNKCDYFAHISCGVDSGMKVKTKTVLCEKCKIVLDVVTEYLTDEVPVESNVGRCVKCSSTEFVKPWDNIKRPCPKCDGQLQETNGTVVMWN